MHLRGLLVETHAHMPPAHILQDLFEENSIRRIANIPHSIAGIVAHMDFWQRWFLRRCRGENVPMISSASQGWPEAASGSWTEVRERFIAGIEEAAAVGSTLELLDRPLSPPIEFPPFADYTVRDALIHVANHNSHHLGQIVTLRQIAELWPPPAGSWTW